VTQRIFDADVHIYPASPASINDYMPDGARLPRFYEGGGGNGFVLTRSGMRLDATPPSGGVAGSDPEYVLEHHLERYGVDYALLNAGHLSTIGRSPSAETVSAVCRATNDWIVNEWLPVDERFLGSICVPTADPDDAAQEIRRIADNKRMVSVYTATLPRLLGDRFYHPIYEACNELDLPFTFHVPATDVGSSLGHEFVGYSQTYAEFHVAFSLPAMRHLLNLVYEGTFERYPNLSIVILESGTAWLPFMLWRMDSEYRANREDIPWLRELPSSYVRKHVRVATQPLEESSPGDRSDVAALHKIVRGQDMLIFASDYPHHDFDNPEIIRRKLPEEWHAKVFFENACTLFHLDERGLLADRARSIV